MHRITRRRASQMHYDRTLLVAEAPCTGRKVSAFGSKVNRAEPCEFDPGVRLPASGASRAGPAGAPPSSTWSRHVGRAAPAAAGSVRRHGRPVWRPSDPSVRRRRGRRREAHGMCPDPAAAWPDLALGLSRLGNLLARLRSRGAAHPPHVAPESRCALGSVRYSRTGVDAEGSLDLRERPAGPRHCAATSVLGSVAERGVSIARGSEASTPLGPPVVSKKRKSQTQLVRAIELRSFRKKVERK